MDWNTLYNIHGEPCGETRECVCGSVERKFNNPNVTPDLCPNRVIWTEWDGTKCLAHVHHYDDESVVVYDDGTGHQVAPAYARSHSQSFHH